MEYNDHAGMRERLRTWRERHPHASFAEIEAAVQQEIVRLQAHLVEEVLEARSPEDEGSVRPHCPECQTPMRPCGHRTRMVVSRLGQPVQVERAYHVCPACGAGLFPPR